MADFFAVNSQGLPGNLTVYITSDLSENGKFLNHGQRLY
jgi:hypothetical protein